MCKADLLCVYCQKIYRQQPPSQEITLSAPSLTKGPFWEFRWEARVGTKGETGFSDLSFLPVSGGGPVFAETIFILYLGHTCVVLPRRRCKPDLQAPRTGRRVAQGWDLGPSFQASVPRVRVRGLTWPSRWGTKAPSCHRVYIFFLNSK